MKEKRPDSGPPGRLRRSKINLSGHDLERAVIVAMVAMRMMQVAIDQVVDMVAMRHGGVADTCAPDHNCGGHERGHKHGAGGLAALTSTTCSSTRGDAVC